MRYLSIRGGSRVSLALFALLPAGLGTLQAEGSQSDSRPHIQLPRIIGGDPVESGAYPWLVGIEEAAFLGLPDGNYQSQFCAGTVIAPYWVLTAAHCMRDTATTFFQPADLKVLVGSTDLIDDPGQLIDIEEIIVHEGFNFTNAAVENDIALLRLAAAVDVTPVSLNSSAENEAPGLESITAGWGSTNPEGTDYPTGLQEVRVPLVSLEDCQAAYQMTDPPAQVLDQQLCAGLLGEGGKDSCSGDSGGPLFVIDDMENPVQTGITSFGAGCADPDFPGVYTRVSSFLDWIEENMAIRIYFSQIGKGSGILSSDLVVFNQSPSAPASGEVLFWNENGDPIDPALFLTPSVVTPSGEGVPPVNLFNLPPFGTTVFHADKLGDLQAGSATVVSSSPVSAVVRFTLNGGIAGVRSSEPGSAFITPVRLQNGVRTGVAVRNTEAEAVEVTLTLYDAAGQMLASQPRDLPVDGRIAEFANEIFSEQVTEGFLGTLTITCQECKVAAIALELGNIPGEFTALPVSPVK